jgi:hypothetical protein
VFAGPAAAETFGDYLAGSSHVLPTDGAARSWSGVSVYSFLKAMSVQQVSPEAARAIAGPAAALARLEGLEAHARAADARANSHSPFGLSSNGLGEMKPERGLARLARPAILALPSFDIAANANDVFGPDAIKLDANENAYKPLVEGGLAADVNRYPEPQPQRLRAAMAALYGVAAENLFVTRGADDAIDLLVRTFCREGRDAVAICSPTFSAYAHFAQLAGARVIETRLDEQFDFSAERFLDDVRGAADLKLAFICAPNNPTGNLVDPAEVLRVCDALPDTIVVADEAYIEFPSSRALPLKPCGGRTCACCGHCPRLTASPAPGSALRWYGRADRADRARGTALSAADALDPCRAERLGSFPAAAARGADCPDQGGPRAAGRRARQLADRAQRSFGGGNFLFLEVDEPERWPPSFGSSASASASGPMRRPEACVSPSAPRPRMKRRCGRSACRCLIAPRGAATSSGIPGRRGSRWRSISTGRRRGGSRRACPFSITCSIRLPRMAAFR